MKVLVTNSSFSKNGAALSLLNGLPGNFSFLLRASDKFFASSLEGGKSFYFGPSAGSWQDVFFLPFCLISWPFYFFWLLYLKIRFNLGALLCFSLNEKILLTLAGTLLGLKVVWLELPEEKYANFSATVYLASVFSSLASVAVFNSESLADCQRFGFCKSRLFSLPPAPDDGYARQDDIFSELAVSDKPKVFFKKFSIGAVMDFSGRTSFELLLKAIKNCSNVIPNIQLVVIGPSAERRNLNWLVKKLGIEKMVWFVGEQVDLVKWFNDLDLFFSLADRPSLYDLENVLLAMSRGVPAVVFQQKAFQDFIVDGQTGLVAEGMTADDLARKLIDVEADKKLLAWIGENGQVLTKERFNRKNQATMLARLFE